MKKIYAIMVALSMLFMTCNADIRYNHKTKMYYSTHARWSDDPILYDDLARVVLSTIEASFMTGVPLTKTMLQVIEALESHGGATAFQLADDLTIWME